MTGRGFHQASEHSRAPGAAGRGTRGGAAESSRGALGLGRGTHGSPSLEETPQKQMPRAQATPASALPALTPLTTNVQGVGTPQLSPGAASSYIGSPVRLATGSTKNSDNWISFKNPDTLNPFEFMMNNNLGALADGMDSLRDAFIQSVGRTANKDAQKKDSRKEDEPTDEERKDAEIMEQVKAGGFEDSIRDSILGFKAVKCPSKPLKTTRGNPAKLQSVDYLAYLENNAADTRKEAEESGVSDDADFPLDRLHALITGLSETGLRDFWIHYAKLFTDGNRRVSTGSGAGKANAAAAAANVGTESAAGSKQSRKRTRTVEDEFENDSEDEDDESYETNRPKAKKNKSTGKAPGRASRKKQTLAEEVDFE